MLPMKEMIGQSPPCHHGATLGDRAPSLYPDIADCNRRRASVDSREGVRGATGDEDLSPSRWIMIDGYGCNAAGLLIARSLYATLVYLCALSDPGVRGLRAVPTHKGLRAHEEKEAAYRPKDPCTVGGLVPNGYACARSRLETGSHVMDDYESFAVSDGCTELGDVREWFTCGRQRREKLTSFFSLAKITSAFAS